MRSHYEFDLHFSNSSFCCCPALQEEPVGLRKDAVLYLYGPCPAVCMPATNG